MIGYHLCFVYLCRFFTNILWSGNHNQVVSNHLIIAITTVNIVYIHIIRCYHRIIERHLKSHADRLAERQKEKYVCMDKKQETDKEIDKLIDR